MEAVAEASIEKQDGLSSSIALSRASDAVRLGLIGFGVYELSRGAILALAVRADSQMGRCTAARDARQGLEQATLDVPLGLALLTAVRHRSWRAPVLGLGSLSWALRALNEMTARPGEHRGWHGAAERLTPAVRAGTLGWLFSRAARAERWATR